MIYVICFVLHTMKREKGKRGRKPHKILMISNYVVRTNTKENSADNAFSQKCIMGPENPVTTSHTKINMNN